MLRYLVDESVHGGIVRALLVASLTWTFFAFKMPVWQAPQIR